MQNVKKAAKRGKSKKFLFNEVKKQHVLEYNGKNE